MKKEELDKLRADYPKGTRLELLEDMKDEKGLIAGNRGTVDYIDDAGSIHMKWDNGRTLAIIPGVDKFKKI